MKPKTEQLKDLYFRGSLYALAVDDFSSGKGSQRTVSVLRIIGEEYHIRYWMYIFQEQINAEFDVCKEKFDDEIWFMVRELLDCIELFTAQDMTTELLDDTNALWMVFGTLLNYLSDDGLKTEVSKAVEYWLECCNDVCEKLDSMAVFRMIGALQAVNLVPVVIIANDQSLAEDPYQRLLRGNFDEGFLN